MEDIVPIMAKNDTNLNHALCFVLNKKPKGKVWQTWLWGRSNKCTYQDDPKKNFINKDRKTRSPNAFRI
jgi:hypothetical protein